MNFEQRRLTMNSFGICYFSYWPVVWMFYSWKLNARINRLHERALVVVYIRVVYNDFDSSFDKLLRRDSSTTLHQRNLQKLMTEIYKVETGIALELMKGVFDLLVYLIIWGISVNVAVDTMYRKVWHWNDIFYRSKTMGRSLYRNKKFQISWGI